MSRKKRANSLTVIDLFCGAGGLSEGFRQAGFRVLVGNDVDKFSGMTYTATHHGAVFLAGPIQSLSAVDFFWASKLRKGELDCLIGGPPCQAFSVYNHQRGLHDERSNLFREYLRIVDGLMPKWVVMENVTGITSAGGGLAMREIVDGLSELGYNVETRILRAEQYGVAQERRRIFLLAIAWESPFIGTRCPKRSTSYPDEPYPVCSIWRGNNEPLNPSDDLICVCPKRFHAVDFLKDVVEYCWPGVPPDNPRIAPEVKMAGFGNVDFVIADMLPNGSVGQFLSVELQAIDITGSVRKAYDALRRVEQLDRRPTYGLNWDNVYKRYITQLIRKGYFHHHWKSKIVAVIQEQIYRNIVERADFMRSSNVKSETVNIIFMTYRFDHDHLRPGQFKPVLARVEGTSHANLQQAILYKEPPSRDMFCRKIAARLSVPK